MKTRTVTTSARGGIALVALAWAMTDCPASAATNRLAAEYRLVTASTNWVDSRKPVPAALKEITNALSLTTGRSLAEVLNSPTRLPVERAVRAVPGGAVADFGRHTVGFTADVASARPLTITAPDGRVLQCRPSFIALHDARTGQSLLLGEITNRLGQIVGSQQVLWTNCFDTLRADVRVTCSDNAVESDLLLRAAPVLPDSIRPADARIEVWTEWFESAPVSKETQSIDLREGVKEAAALRVADEALDFGMMKMVRGHAFGMDTPDSKVAVAKAWVQTQGRTFTVESVDWQALQPQLKELPLVKLAALTPATPGARLVDLRRTLPVRGLAQATRQPMQLAALAPVAEPGVVVDFVIVNAVPLMQNAAGWWKAANNANDAVSTNHGTLQGSATYGAGQVGQAFALDGTDAYVSAPDNAAWAFGTNNFTIEFWLRLNDLAPPYEPSIEQPEAIFVGHDAGGGAASKWFLALGGGVLNFHVNGAGGSVFLEGGAFSPDMDTWYHLALVRSGSNFTFYTNGAVLGTAVTNLSIPNPAALLSIGQAEDLGFVNGLIDELTVYQRALASSEIAAIHGAGGAGKASLACVSPATNAVGWWSGDSNIYDLARTNFAVLTNGASYGEGAVWQAFALDGADDYVLVPDRAEWTLGTNNFTVELWVNFQALETHAEYWDPEAIFLGHDEGGGAAAKWFFALGAGYLNFHVNGPGLDSEFLGMIEFGPDLDRWYHLAVARSNTTLRFYVDGALAGSDTLNVALPNPAAPLTLGQAEGIGFINGRLDEVTLYNRALTGTEISAIHSAGWGGKCKVDTDQDGLTDLQEAHLGTNPADTDTDTDNLLDGDEVFVHHTDPKNPDTDGDLMPDGWELAHGFDPLNPADGALDADGDKFSNRLEYMEGSDPNSAASTPLRPGLPNGAVQDYSTNAPPSGGGAPIVHPPGLVLCGPVITGTNASFTYCEGATNLAYDLYVVTNLSVLNWKWQAQFVPGVTNLTVGQTNAPNAFYRLASGADLDGDGLADNWEANNGLNPNNSADGALDTDDDGLTNLEEFHLGTDPLVDESTQSAKRFNYGYDATGRLRTVSGSRDKQIISDGEGNVRQAAP